METVRIGAVMFALGLVAGGAVTTMVLHPSIAIAQPATGQMSMPMGTNSPSPGDVEMSDSMKRMMQTVSQAHLTGVQDHDFLLLMIPHHQAAVDMAEVEVRRGAHPELKALAQEIVRGQNQEVAQMRGMLKAWYGDTASNNAVK
jgi:uncharacterized protein (DUF305 family)